MKQPRFGPISSFLGRSGPSASHPRAARGSIAWVLALGLSLGGCATTAASGPDSTSPSAAAADPVEQAPAKGILPAHVEDFDYAWERIRETHWDPDRVGASWDAARAELRPKVVAAKTPDEARAVIRELLGRLGQSHFQLAAAGSQSDADDGADAPASGPPGSVGLDVRLVEGKPLVTRVTPGGPADKAGIELGWAVLGIGDERFDAPPAQAADEKGAAEPATGSEGDSDKAEERMLGRVYKALDGAAGQRVELELEVGGDVRTISIERAPVKLASFGNLQNVPVEYESRELASGVGYIRLSIFFDPAAITPKFRADVLRFQGAPGIVLDLRGNPGGIGGMAMGLGGLFITGSGQRLGTMIDKTTRLDFVLNPQPGAFTGKLAILVDGGCASTCEILAGGLADLRRATVFGTRSAGAALPSQIETLPSGDLLQFAVANFVSASGSPLEGAGVEPNVVVELDRASLLRGVDPQLAAAIKWIGQP